MHFFPKFHCELNFIERYWGAAKTILGKDYKKQCLRALNQYLEDFQESAGIIWIYIEKELMVNWQNMLSKNINPIGEYQMK